MKILHTSDWHLGKNLHANSLFEEQAHVLGKIMEELKQEYDAVLISGDIYDRAIPPTEAVDLFGSFLDWVSENNISAIIIPGNHDSSSRLNFANRSLEKVGIHFRSDFRRLSEPITINDNDGREVDIFCIPFVETSFVRDQLGDNEINNYLQATQCCIEKTKDGIRDDVPSILISHAFVGNSIEELETSDSERELFVGGSGLVPVDFFDGFDYVALGHLHRAQKVSNKSNVRYSGSIYQYSFSEAGHNKIAIKLEWNDNDFRVYNVPLDSLRRVRIIEDQMDNVLTDKKYTDYEKSYVSVRLTDKGHLINIHPRLRERFPFLLEVRQPGLEYHRERISTPSARVDKDNPKEIFNLFLDEFDWEEDADRDEALDIFDGVLEDVEKNRREVKSE